VLKPYITEDTELYEYLIENLRYEDMPNELKEIYHLYEEVDKLDFAVNEHCKSFCE
jgi:hypothetical protein